MLNNIHIQNFRCFEDFKADGFERINLIGGKNNSGKTCLLEAIACLTNKFSYHNVSGYRDNSNIPNALINKNNLGSTLWVSAQLTNSQITEFSIAFDLVNGNPVAGGGVSNPLNINFITQKIELPQLSIINSFDEFDAKLLKSKLIDILKTVDNRIEDIRTFSSKNGLYIKLIDSVYEPLSNFGDATKNLIRYFTPIFEKELTATKSELFSVLLIDEIENGIHYSAHYDFWKNIFKLSKELNVQVFATTHSLEMINAFNEVAKEDGEGAYFEMSREFETGKIFAFKHDTELLEYELEKTTSTIRG